MGDRKLASPNHNRSAPKPPLYARVSLDLSEKFTLAGRRTRSAIAHRLPAHRAPSLQWGADPSPDVLALMAPRRPSHTRICLCRGRCERRSPSPPSADQVGGSCSCSPLSTHLWGSFPCSKWDNEDFWWSENSRSPWHKHALQTSVTEVCSSILLLVVYYSCLISLAR